MSLFDVWYGYLQVIFKLMLKSPCDFCFCVFVCKLSLISLVLFLCNLFFDTMVENSVFYET